MTKDEAIRAVATAFDLTIVEVKKTVDEVKRTVDNLNASMTIANNLFDRIKAMGKLSKAFQQRKSFVSPYAKFDKYHKKKRK